ncbi:MAG: HEAT repeat domain-containing protein [Phototrophicaceae bacterium]
MTDNHQPDSWNLQSFDIRGLVAALTDEDTLIRRRAATALGAMDAIESLSALQRAHLAEDDAETRAVMSASIQALKKSTSENLPKVDDSHDANDVDDEQIVYQLIEQLKSTDATTIIEAAETLGELGEKIAVEGLILAFNNPKHTIHVRLAIAEALLKLESAPVEVALLANLRHTDWHIRRNGAAILGQLQAEWAVEPLAGSLNDPHPVVRRTALAALKHIGTPESRKALAQFAPTDNRQPPTRSDTRTEVSGIAVKRPGKSDDSAPSSPLLKRIKQERDAERARRSTQPFNAESEFLKAANNPKQIDATQPIRDNLLDDLDAILGDDDES